MARGSSVAAAAAPFSLISSGEGDRVTLAHGGLSVRSEGDTVGVRQRQGLSVGQVVRLTSG